MPQHSAEFQQSLLQAINDASPDGILVVDDHGIIVSHNRRFMEIWRISASDFAQGRPATAIGTSDEPLLATVLQQVKDKAGFLARVQELYANPDLDDHSEIELVDGRTIERHSTVLRGAQGNYLGRVWYFRDISDHIAIEAELQRLARHDALTGLFNRRYYDERAAVEFARAARYHTPLAIAEFDIDHFKRINDAYGHAAGDELLKAVCDAARTMIRQTNLFARIGGEEFAVLLTNCPVEGAVIFAERLRGLVAGTAIAIDGRQLSCTISIGIAARRERDRSPEECLQRADAAMYRAKENGRNRVEMA
jgi:diguanylate cyclase (GGDEF)-like protein